MSREGSRSTTPRGYVVSRPPSCFRRFIRHSEEPVTSLPLPTSDPVVIFGTPTIGTFPLPDIVSTFPRSLSLRRNAFGCVSVVPPPTARRMSHCFARAMRAPSSITLAGSRTTTLKRTIRSSIGATISYDIFSCHSWVAPLIGRSSSLLFHQEAAHQPVFRGFGPNAIFTGSEDCSTSPGQGSLHSCAPLLQCDQGSYAQNTTTATSGTGESLRRLPEGLPRALTTLSKPESQCGIFVH